MSSNLVDRYRVSPPFVCWVLRGSALLKQVLANSRREQKQPSTQTERERVTADEGGAKGASRSPEHTQMWPHGRKRTSRLWSEHTMHSSSDDEDPVDDDGDAAAAAASAASTSAPAPSAPMAVPPPPPLVISSPRIKFCICLLQWAEHLFIQGVLHT